MSETLQLLPRSGEPSVSRRRLEEHIRKQSDSSKLVACLTAWASMIAFGAFALFQYILPVLVDGNWNRWNITDDGLYRPRNSMANTMMVAHMMCGVVLQGLGPIQLIASIRRKYIHVHRILGRIYIGAALGASGLATMFVLCFRTSRKWIHEDVGNVMFGLAVFSSAVMSLYYIRIGEIEKHRLWSVRLFLAVFGATLFRIVAVPYVVPVLLGAPSSQLVVNSLFFVIFLPSWLGYEIMRRKPIGNTLIVGASALWTVLTLIIFIGAWLPAMMNQPSLQSGALEGG